MYNIGQPFVTRTSVSHALLGTIFGVLEILCVISGAASALAYDRESRRLFVGLGSGSIHVRVYMCHVSIGHIYYTAVLGICAI